MNAMTSAQQSVLLSVLREVERIAAANVLAARECESELLAAHYGHLLRNAQQSLSDVFNWSPSYTADGRSIPSPQYKLPPRLTLVERAMQ